ncbi:MAG TPA: DNA ligase D [Solirubrobacteraceae bacterium]
MTSRTTRAELREYITKRDFRATPEPPPSASTGRSSRSKSAGARFVVHEHHARRLHWDLRLEHAGALMSWAVPNGIPRGQGENRKAIHVEDHPLSYIDFEGEIPQGSYGAGRVLVWDSGTYDSEKFEDSKIVVRFRGKRLRGRYALIRTGAGEDWLIHRMEPPASPRESMPEHLTPMLATSSGLPRDEDSWAYEVKWDGVRAITYWRPGRLRIESRNLNDVSSRYPELRPLGRQLGMREAVLDGEIVALDERGAPSFARLQGRMHLASQSAIRRLSREQPVTYMIFDVLYLDGTSTMELPYRERRELLEELRLTGPAWQVPAYHRGEGQDFLAATREHGLEGVVAKRLDSPYRSGRRGREWLKVKNMSRQELVIGGWLAGRGARRGRVGALLTGYYEGCDSRPVLRYAGRVGTGFDESELERLALELSRRARRSSPFAHRGVQPPREARFVEPELVCEVEFSHWTRDRILRHPSYKGLRFDKAPSEVIMETATPPPQRSQPRQVLAETDRPSSHNPYRIVHETKRHTEIEVQNRRLRLSNLGKVLYPEAGFTKGEMIDYYVAVAPVLLGHLAGRPLTLKRYPDGVQGPFFYQKRCPAHRPDWVKTAAIFSERQRGEIDYCLAEDLPTLIWAANLADIELHTSLSRARDMDCPTAVVFDLDPGPPAGLKECCRVALEIRKLLEDLGLQTLVKTSGSKGLQVYLPLNAASSYTQTKPFARAVAELLQKRHPRLVVARMAKNLRPGKVLVDWSQNDPHKTTVCVYSLRAQERPTISTPLDWEEVTDASRRRRETQLSAEPAQMLQRVESSGDLFAPLLSLAQSLPAIGDAGFYETPPRGSSSAPSDLTERNGGVTMPPSGVKKGSKRERQYKHVKESARKRGASEGRAKEIASRTVNKERARSGESRTRSRTSTSDTSSGRRGGARSDRAGARGRTREELYQEARKLGVEGRSNMNKAQLQRAVDNKKH